MSAKSAFPPTRKSEMYDYSASLMRYRELRNLSHASCFRACQSSEEYQRLKMVLNGQDGSKESSRGQEECIRFGPVLPQTTEIDCGDLEKVMDPMHVQGRGAPKKRLQAKMKKQRSKRKCGYCGVTGHDRRNCTKLQEVSNMSIFNFCICFTH